MNLSLDRQSITETCSGCGAEFRAIRGSVYDSSEPVGLYLVALHGHNPDGPIAHLAIGLLDPRDRTTIPVAVAMDVIPTSGDYGFSVVDWEDSPWKAESYLGERADRSDVLEHPRRSDFFEIGGYVARSLEEVGRYLFAH